MEAERAERVLTKREFGDRMTWSQATLERREAEAAAAGDISFPRKRKLGRGRVGKIGYLESEVNAYIQGLPLGSLQDRTAAAKRVVTTNRQARAKKPVRR